MHTHNLYHLVLVEPAKDADQLIAVSGYVSGQLAKTHLLPPDKAPYKGLPSSVRFDLVYGMYPKAGIDPSDAKVLCEVQEARPGFTAHCTLSPPVHAKVYVWLSGGSPVTAYAGSANYSVSAFFGKTVESIAEVDPQVAHDFVRSVLSGCQPLCTMPSPVYRSRILEQVESKDESSILEDRLTAFERVDLPLYVESENRIHGKSGLNWGQRDGRDKNQAYIPIPSRIAKSGFFPPRQTFFALLTDDGELFECVVAQDGDKAIETPGSNALLGDYFRRRLAVPSGVFVTLEDLDRYGRRYVTIYRIAEDKYFLDFRVTPRP